MVIVAVYVSDLIVAIAFLAFGAGCWLFRVSYRVSVLAGLALLVLLSIGVALGKNEVTNFIATTAYYFLAAGVILAILEHWRTSEKEADQDTINALPELKAQAENPPICVDID